MGNSLAAEKCENSIYTSGEKNSFRRGCHWFERKTFSKGYKPIKGLTFQDLRNSLFLVPNETH